MLLYQRDNSTLPQHVRVDLYEDFAFVPHLHKDFEFVLVLDGALEVCLHSRTETAGVGDLALIFPNEIHAYATPAHSRVLVCVFSGDYVGAFLHETAGSRGTRSVFESTPGLRAYLGDCYLERQAMDKFSLKASFYAVCAQYLQVVPLAPFAEQNDDLLCRLLSYVEERYREDISLVSAARAIGYSPNYLSRFFHAAVGLHFRRFLNQYRVQYACRLIEERELTMTEIALESGFQNIRSFNRAFVEIMGCAPTQYARAQACVSRYVSTPE